MVTLNVDGWFCDIDAHECCLFLLLPGNQVQLMVQMLFPKNVKVPKVDSLPIHTARSVQS